MVSIKNIISKIPVLDYVGDESQIIENVIELDVNNTSNSVLFWCSDKNSSVLQKLTAGAVIISKNTFEKVDFSSFNGNLLVVDNPRLYFALLLKTFFVEKEEYSKSSSAIIHESVKLPTNIYIGGNVVIEKGVIISENVRIDSNSVIKSNTIIKENSKIGANCTIGGVGFGYEKNEEGENILIPHIGNVIIEKNVEIGNNVCIDKAVIGSTIIGENVKVDNLVHIAHGVKIGKNSMVIANSMIAGSVIIGKNVWISPSSSIIQKTKIGDNSLIGLGSVVLRNVESGNIVAGVPAKQLNKK